jgi:hypothetical protein
MAPPPLSPRAVLRNATALSQIVATVLTTAVCVRFAIAGAEHALGVSGANFSDKPVPHKVPEPAAEASAAPALSRSAARPVESDGRPAIDPSLAGKPLRITLSVSSGSPRSEVYVNGSHVGNAPFLGDTSCKAGQTLRIEVVPAAGAPLTYLRVCRGAEIVISGLPP